METELWPNLLHECRRRGVPVILASARLTREIRVALSPSRTLFREALSEMHRSPRRSTEDAERFIAMGADPARTQWVGNLKFDMQLGAEVIEEGRELRAEYLGPRPVWIAGSTHGGRGGASARGARRQLDERFRDAPVDAGAAPSATLRERG